MRTNVVKEMSWVEFDERRKETKTVIIPSGAVEVYGPHLPMGSDIIVSKKIAELVAEKTGGLSIEGLAPKKLGRLDKKGSPRNAVLFTLACMWLVLSLGLSAGGAALYEKLLSVSGFTGTLAWIGIIASQLQFRKRLKKNGYNPQECLKACVSPKQQWISIFALAAQTICLVMLAFGKGQQAVFVIACLAVIIPVVIYRIVGKRGREENGEGGENGEKTFDEMFPPLRE